MMLLPEIIRRDMQRKLGGRKEEHRGFGQAPYARCVPASQEASLEKLTLL